jgi:hypothetical protein
MHVLRIEHPVPDYDAWRQAFESDPLDRAKSGVRRYRILRGADDPNYVAIELEFDTAGEAETMHERLKELWSRVDVARNPSARVFEVAGDGEY